MKRTLTPLKGYSDLEWAIKHAGAWFIGSFMVEILDEYEAFQKKDTKNAFIERFYEDYDITGENIAAVRTKINLAIRIIESGMVEDAMEYVINTNDKKLGCEQSKVNAQFLLDRLATGESVLPIFE